jgi:hypothetical protein
MKLGGRDRGGGLGGGEVRGYTAAAKLASAARLLGIHAAALGAP